MLSCISSTLCCDANVDGLLEAANDSQRLAQETGEICNGIKDRGQNLLDVCSDIQGKLSRFGKKIDATTYKHIMELLESQSKMKETIEAAGEMDDMALECLGKSNEMTKAMEKGIESLPTPVKDEIMSEGNDEEENKDRDTELLADVNEDIKDLEDCTESIQNMNLFSAARSGSSAFEGLASKGELCQTIFDKVKELAGSVLDITGAFVGQTCCAQVQAVFTQGRDILSCLRMSTLMSKLAEAGDRLVKAIMNLLKIAEEKIMGFMEEFQAAKKIQHFVNDKLDPIKSTAGEFVDSVKNSGFGSGIARLIAGE